MLILPKEATCRKSECQNEILEVCSAVEFECSTTPTFQEFLGSEKRTEREKTINCATTYCEQPRI